MMFKRDGLDWIDQSGEIIPFADVSPPFDFYKGRDTSMYAMTAWEPSMTSQEFAAECDINDLMRKYEKTGTFPQPVGRQPFYVDNVDVPSYQDAMNMLIAAEEAFMSLPSRIRAEFDNDPQKFVEFAENDKNRSKLKEWGMLSPEAVARFDKEAAEAAIAAQQAAKPQAASEPPGEAGTAAQ